MEYTMESPSRFEPTIPYALSKVKCCDNAGCDKLPMLPQSSLTVIGDSRRQHTTISRFSFDNTFMISAMFFKSSVI
jgi:hypothetical protein